MGIFPTFYAHWRLNAMIRLWRKSTKLFNRINSYMHTYATDEQKDAFGAAMAKLNAVMEEVQQSVEDEIIAEIKERV